jgi:glycosyltransferase involved in cell wall biosynthesis
MSQMKIAHLAQWLEVGGTEQVIFDLCRLGGGQQWVVACHDGPRRPFYEQHGITVRLAPRPELVIQHLAEADVVNVHWNVNWVERCRPFYAALLAARKPLVFTVHGLNVLPRLPGLVICTSRRVYELQTANEGRCLLIANGVDTIRFHPRPRPPRQCVRIIRVCRPIRCAEYFWPAVSQVLQECPEAELVTVGGPPFTLGRIQALGDRFDIPELLAAADIFAYTPFPNEGTRDLVVLEAMASGLACVVADAPCVRESIGHGVTGLLTPFRDPQAFAAALIRLVRDSALRQALGDRAARTAQQGLDMRPRAALYGAAYRRALIESGAAQPIPRLPREAATRALACQPQKRVRAN